MMCHSDGQRTFERSQRETPYHLIPVFIVIVAALISMGGTAAMLDNTQQMSRMEANVHLGMSLCTIVTTWLLVHTQFALHYARVSATRSRRAKRTISEVSIFRSRSSPTTGTSCTSR